MSNAISNLQNSPPNGGSRWGASLPRGLRNNNPLNIRLSKTVWQGQTNSLHSKDSLPSGGQGEASFCQFSSLAYGFRAAFRLIHTYMTKYGLRNITQIIMRWAPPSENNTSAYVHAVTEMSGINALETLDWHDEKQMVAVVQAMAYVENGRIIAGDSIHRGYRMAKMASSRGQTP